MVMERPFLGSAFLPNNCIRGLATFPSVLSASKDARPLKSRIPQIMRSRPLRAPSKSYSWAEPVDGEQIEVQVALVQRRLSISVPRDR